MDPVITHDAVEVPAPGRAFQAIARWLPAFLCASAGFLSGFTVNLVGKLPAGELILLAVFPWVLIRLWAHHSWPGRIQQFKWYKLLFVLLGVMLFGYIISDLYRGTSGSNLVRGWARVGFLIVDFISIAYLINDSWRRLYVFVLCLTIGSSINALITGPMGGEYWKFGVGYTFTALCLFLIGGLRPVWQILAAVALAGLSLALGARSLGSICLLTAGLFWLRYARGVLKPLAVLLAVGAIGGLFLAANTVFLENQEHSSSNVERQSMIEVAGEAFLSSPLLGQGSWFTATQMISRLEEKRASKESGFRGYSEEEARQISIHSQLLAALAEGGILAGMFFFGLGCLLLRTLRAITTQAMPHRAFLFYLVIAGLWNLCMTPFSGVTRLEIVLVACASLLVILQQQGELSEDYRE